jgi:hypothetical protein
MLVLLGLVCLSMTAGYSLLEPRLAEAWLHFWGFVPAEVNDCPGRCTGQPGWISNCWGW